jgi:hypothetical protein
MSQRGDTYAYLRFRLLGKYITFHVSELLATTHASFFVPNGLSLFRTPTPPNYSLLPVERAAYHRPVRVTKTDHYPSILTIRTVSILRTYDNDPAVYSVTHLNAQALPTVRQAPSLRATN